MRVWTLFRGYGTDHALWNSQEDIASHSRKWSVHCPFNNVLWIHYIMEYLIKRVKRHVDLAGFLGETELLREKLNPDRPACEGGFASAAKVLEFCLEQGWINMEDVTSMEDSRLES